MAGRVILFGATGFTGRLTAEAMVRAGLAPVLAGRDADALVTLTGDLAGLGPMDRPPTWRTADAAEPESVRALVESPDDVLVTTVGPFARLGRAAVDAAVDAGCGYVDSTGEPGFIRTVFTEDGARATSTGARLITAFGYDYVPGNLAAALAIRDTRAAGRVPTTVEVGYFVKGGLSLSSGTKASAVGAVAAPPFSLRSGHLVEGHGSVATFDVGGEQWSAMPVGTSEAFTLPRLDPGVRDVTVYLGWAGRLTRVAHAAGTALGLSARVPVLGSVVRAGVGRVAGDTTREGPSREQRARSSTLVVARTRDGVGRSLASVRLEGPSPYDLTAELLAWGAAMLLTGRTTEVGALGPVDAFGLDALIAGCADMGLRRVD